MVQIECSRDRELEDLLRMARFGNGVKVIYLAESDVPIIYDTKNNAVITGEEARRMVQDYRSKRKEMLN